MRDETTAWERAGFGLWRRERGVMLRVASSRGCTWAEVSADNGRDAVNLYSPPVEAEADAQAWCERWAAVVLGAIGHDRNGVA